MFDILGWLENNKPIKLVAGKGSPEEGGCWMSALSQYSGESWSDHPDCVCPIIRKLCISINDILPNDESRGRTIGPRLFDVVGTNTGDLGIELKRMRIFVDAVQPLAEYTVKYVAAELASAAAAAAELASASAAAAKYAAAELASASAAAVEAAAATARVAARAARAAAELASAAAVKYAAAESAKVAARVAARAAARAAATREEFVIEKLFPILDEMLKVGSKRDIEMQCDTKNFEKSLQLCDG